MRLLMLAVLAAVPSCFPSSSGDDIECAFNDRYLHSTDTETMNTYDGIGTAVGGTQRFAGVDRTCGVESPLELRIATVADPTLATVKIFNGVAAVTGVADGLTTLDTTDTLYREQIRITVATIKQVAVQTVATGTPFAVISLADRAGELPGVGINPLVDDSLTVSGTLALGDHWDHLAIGNTPPGDYAETIHAGGVDWPVTVTVTP